MTVNVGTMQLPVPEDPDAVRTYLNGTHVSGGLWTSLTRASNHDHSGGLNGIQLTATSIPDGSITGAKLDPSVLLPYALVDGSKPFTGIVTMNADQLIRDTLRFGAKPAGVADTTIARTGAGALRVDTHLGVGANPAGWASTWRAIQVGLNGVVTGTTDAGNLVLRENSYNDAGGNKAIVTGAAGSLNLSSGFMTFFNAPSVAAGAAQVFTARAQIAPTGTLTLTPDTSAPPVVLEGTSDRGVRFNRAGVARWFEGISGGDPAEDWKLYRYNDAGGFLGTPLVMSRATGTLTLTPDAGQNFLSGTSGTSAFSIGPGVAGAANARLAASNMLELDGGTNYVIPSRQQQVALGHPNAMWTVIYAQTGAINTSSAALKEGITPLSPAECYQAAKDVRWYEYAYLPPAYTAPEPPPDIAYDAADDNETKAEKKAARDAAEAASKAAHLKMVAETAPARHQRGFVFGGAESKDELGGALPPVPDLFGLSDRQSTTPQADLATLGAALQEVIRRLEALEAPN